MIDSFVLFVQAHRLHQQVLDPQLAQATVEHEAKGASLVTTIDRIGLGNLALNPDQEFLRHEGLGRLWRAVIEDACHHD